MCRHPPQCDPHQHTLGGVEMEETEAGSRGHERSPATGQKRERCRPDFRAMSPCPLSLPLALLTQLLRSSFSSYYSALYGGQVDTRGTSLMVPAPASPRCQQTLGHTRLSLLWGQERIPLHRMDYILGLEIIFLISLLIPMLSIKPLHSLISLNCSCLGVIFLLFSPCLTATPCPPLQPSTS